MNIINFKILNYELIKGLPGVIKKHPGNSLILSFIQENRFLEIEYEIENEIIYDNSDYLNGTIDLEIGIIEINENTFILPSSYRIKVSEYDYFNIIEDLNHIKNDYDNIFILVDGKINFKNLKQCIDIKCRKDIDKLLGKRSILDKIKGLFINEK